MKIFENYTGNAILNNALMTIEALANLSNVSEITPKLLLSLYKEVDLKAINKRLKSYTMVFSLNNPLVNPAKAKDNAGEKTYHNLLTSILNNFEDEGENICEISGLRFNKTFEKFYLLEIERQKQELKLKNLNAKEEKKLINALSNADISLNRSWFPLIGGLGSDAQALPQARFTIQIHPICIPILQFLPLSALLYKGGVLCIDSSNFEFSRKFVSDNVKEVRQRIETTSIANSVDNIKDFSKGNYLLKALAILDEKEMEEEYSDLNLWSFSNSGTGASCEIERVPNDLIKKLIRLKNQSSIEQELKLILSNNSSRFIEALEANKEWYLLYPNIFGTGIKKVEYEGVSVEFLDAFFKEIHSNQKIDYAKYLAYLIDKYKTESFAAYLEKRDAYKDKSFKEDLFAVLIKATGNDEWNLNHHFNILDNPNNIPIKNNFYTILKVAHFYYYKKHFNSQIPSLQLFSSKTRNICEWLISYIQNDSRKETTKKDLANKEYKSINFIHLFYRACENHNLDLESIFYALFDNDYNNSTFGVNTLLRIFFSQPHQEYFEIRYLEKLDNWELDNGSKEWFTQIQEFAQDYQNYYFNKYENKETGTKPHSKFQNLVKAINNENSKFLIWFYKAIENTNEFLKSEERNSTDKWSESLLYNPQGDYSLTFAKFSIKFLLFKQCLQIHHVNS